MFDRIKELFIKKMEEHDETTNALAKATAEHIADVFQEEIEKNLFNLPSGYKEIKEENGLVYYAFLDKGSLHLKVTGSALFDSKLRTVLLDEGFEFVKTGKGVDEMFTGFWSTEWSPESA